MFWRAQAVKGDVNFVGLLASLLLGEDVLLHRNGDSMRSRVVVLVLLRLLHLTRRVSRHEEKPEQ